MKEKIIVFTAAMLAAFIVYGVHQFLATHIQCYIQ